MDQERIENILKYRFNDSSWLRKALTHPSHDRRKSTNLAYERLEYLGDAVLELAVSRELFIMFPQSDEGELTKFRARVVSRAHLAQKSREYGFGNELELSDHLVKTGGRETESILANTFETLIGAVMMDGDYASARRTALHLLGDSLRRLAESPQDTNSKGELQIALQAINGEAPVYETMPENPAQTHPFVSTVLWKGIPLGTGKGTSKRRAEVAAAADALARRIWLNP